MDYAHRTGSTRDGQPAPADSTDQTGYEPLDKHCEVATVLLSKRWQKRDEPFEGFDSPPGKF